MILRIVLLVIFSGNVLGQEMGFNMSVITNVSSMAIQQSIVQLNQSTMIAVTLSSPVNSVTGKLH